MQSRVVAPDSGMTLSQTSMMVPAKAFLAAISIAASSGAHREARYSSCLPQNEFLHQLVMDPEGLERRIVFTTALSPTNQTHDQRISSEQLSLKSIK